MTTWQATAAARLQAELGTDGLAPWRHGLWVTAREGYAEVPLPEGFRVACPVLGGEPRRLARADGPGRPLVVLPGLYSDLHEELFVRIATEAHRAGRPVLLLEDRLARSTVALAGPPRHELASLGEAVAELLADVGPDADVLALSAGLIAAWSGPAATARWHRLVGFSGLRDPASTATHLQHALLVRRHFAACHRRAGLDALWPFAAFCDWLAAQPRLPPPAGSWLLVHAIDDPVVPIDTLDDLPRDRVVRLPAGGHLAFGVLGGPSVFLAPFGRDDG